MRTDNTWLIHGDKLCGPSWHNQSLVHSLYSDHEPSYHRNLLEWYNDDSFVRTSSSALNGVGCQELFICIPVSSFSLMKHLSERAPNLYHGKQSRSVKYFGMLPQVCLKGVSQKSNKMHSQRRWDLIRRIDLLYIEIHKSTGLVYLKTRSTTMLTFHETKMDLRNDRMCLGAQLALCT